MKKLLFSAIALCAAISASAENSVSLVPLTVNPGQQVWAPINLECDGVDVVDLTFEVWLPEGFTFVGGGRTGKNWADGTTTKFSTDRSQYMFTNGQGLWSGSINENTRGYYLKVGGVGGKDDYIDGYNGEFMQVCFKVADTVAPGVYPIKFMNCSFNSYGQKEVLNETYVSYIVVGTPEAKPLAFEAGILPSFVNDELAKDTHISKLDLSEVTGVNGTFTYVDGREVTGATSLSADLCFEGTKAGYYSVKVPYDATIASGELYEMDQMGLDCVFFESASTVKKGRTYLAKGPVKLTASNAEVGNVQKETGLEGMFILDEKMWYGENLTVTPTHGVFDGEYSSNLRIVINGELTSINAAEIDGFNATSFDLQGRQVQSAKNGVYVVNGKKQIVK